MAKGISMGGEYIGSKIDKQEQVQVSQETKSKLTKTKETVSSTFEVTTDFLKQLLKPVADKASELKKDLNDHIDKSNNESISVIWTLSTQGW